MTEKNWKKIKAEYIRGGTSYRKLAEKYSVPYATLARTARIEKWCEQKNQSDIKANTIITDSIAEENASKALRINDVAEKLLDKIFEMAECTLSTRNLKELTSALKDIKDIKNIKSELDMREQEARIKKLQKEIDVENNDKTLTVVFEEDIDDYAN